MKGDELIAEIQKRLSEALAPRVGALYVSDLMAYARTVAPAIILDVAKKHGLDVVALKKLPRHDLFIVQENPDDPGAVKISLSNTLRAMCRE